jgi:hypothetical protein
MHGYMDTRQAGVLHANHAYTDTYPRSSLDACTHKIFNSTHVCPNTYLDEQVEKAQKEKAAVEEQMEELTKELEALRDARATREVQQAVATGSKVVLQPHEQVWILSG